MFSQENPYSGLSEGALLSETAGPDEHLIKCNVCGRNLIVRDTINNGVAFLSHLKNDHDIFFQPQRMTEVKTRKKERSDNQVLSPPE